MQMKVRLVVLFLNGLLLCACGGGGSGGNSNVNTLDTPVLSIAVAFKQLRFMWGAVSGATHYRLMVNPDGASGFTQLGDDLAGGATAMNVEISVHLQDWVNARYMLEACDANRCRGSDEIAIPDQALSAIGYFKAGNTGAGDGFGSAVAVSKDGSTLVVGALGEASASKTINEGEDDDSAAGAGAVYVFVRDSDSWVQQAYLKAANTGAGDGFGISVALNADGSVLAVGAYQESSDGVGINNGIDNDNAVAAGAAYVFVRESNLWSQQAYVKAGNTSADDWFGFAVAISEDGDTLAVGARFEDGSAAGINGTYDDTLNDAGAAYVFVRENAVWIQQAYIKPSNPDENDHFANALALNADGTVLAVGSIREDGSSTGVNGANDNLTTSSGAVYVFSQLSAGWTQQAYIKPDNTDIGDLFGHRVDLNADGTVLGVTALNEDGSGVGVNPQDNNDAPIAAGAAYIFTYQEGVWTQEAYVKASNTEDEDYFGMSMALNDAGNLLAVSAISEEGNAVGVNGTDNNEVMNAGAAYLYVRENNGWNFRTYIKAANTDAEDGFGMSVALSGDGETLAIGAMGEDGNGLGVNTPDSNEATEAGAVYLY